MTMAPDALSVTVAVPSCHRLSRLSSRAPCPWGAARTSLWRTRGGSRLGAGSIVVGGSVGATQPDSRTITPASNRRFMARLQASSGPRRDVADLVQAAAARIVDEIGAQETARRFLGNSRAL